MSQIVINSFITFAAAPPPTDALLLSHLDSYVIEDGLGLYEIEDGTGHYVLEEDSGTPGFILQSIGDKILLS